jgi:hypothetical protein
MGRILNDPIGCKFSSFRPTVFPAGAASHRTSGEIMLNPSSRARAASICAIATGFTSSNIVGTEHRWGLLARHRDGRGRSR